MRAILLLPIVIACLATYVFNDYQQLIILYIAINIILAVSLNLVNGFCGQFSLGHAGFMALGGYMSAALSFKFHPFDGPFYFLNFVFYAIAGGMAAGAAGFVVGLPSLRLKGDYLAIVTLGFGEIIRVIFLNTESLGGARGLYGIAGQHALSFLGLNLSPYFMSCWAAYFWATVSFVVIWRWVHSSYGRAFLSVREDEMASECMGVNTTQTKVLAFVISSFFAGLAGSVYAHTNNYLSPASFQFTKSVDVVIMVVLGGMGSLTGSVIAAIIVTILPEALRPVQELTGVDIRMVLYSLLLILLMILRPQGLLGGRELQDVWREWINVWRTYVRRRT
jgi:branched-chain amino acid transport system permease protein